MGSTDVLLKIYSTLECYFKIVFYQLKLIEERAVITDFKSYICYLRSKMLKRIVRNK